MFTQAYFNLALEVHRARSFEQLVELLTNRLPEVVGGDGCLLFVTLDGHKVEEVYGDNSFANDSRNRLAQINELFSCHPLVSKVDLSKPGELGFSVRDFVTKEEFQSSVFLQAVHGEVGMQDALFGLLAHGYGRSTLLIVNRVEGAFSPEERGMFDSFLLTARSVASLIATEDVRSKIRNFFVKNSPQSPQALFVIKDEGEVMPFNHGALRTAEDWWGADDAFLSLPKSDLERIKRCLHHCWMGPLSTSFRDLEIDLGGGMLRFSGLPAWDGETWLVLSLSDREAAGREAIKALLTERQQEIMHWIAEGKTSAEVGIILDISPRTVEKHLEAIFRRLGVETRIAAVRTYLDIKEGQLV